MKTLFLHTMIIGVLFNCLAGKEVATAADILAFEYPPYLIDSKEGIGPKVINEAARISKVDVDILVRPRKRAIWMFKTFDNYMFIGERRYFPDMIADLDARKMIYSRVVLVYKKKKFPSLAGSRIEDFKGKSIGVSLGSNLTPMFQMQGWKVQTAPKVEYNLKKLLADRIDFWGTLGLAAVDLIEKNAPELRDELAIWEVERFAIELVVKKNSPVKPVFDKLIKGFESSIRTGKYKEILESYYGEGKLPASVMINQ